MKHLFLIIGIFSGLLLLRCSDHSHSHDNGHEDHHELPSVAVTLWTDKMELFMEYPVPVVSMTTKFIIHLTNMDSFKPAREGSVSLRFRHESGKSFQINRDYLLREGIFTPTAEFPLAGKYEFTIEYDGKLVSESFPIHNFIVYESVDLIPDDTDDGSEDISFLKEQQWKTEFETKPVEFREIPKSVKAVGEILPRQSSYAEITSPVEGVLQVDNNRTMVTPGSRVDAGQILATLSPSLGAMNSWTHRKLDFELALAEFERAQRLKEKNAISNREFETIRNNYLVAKAGYETFDQADDSELFHLKASIGGVVTGINVLPGQKVAAGQKVMTIVDPSVVWLRANVFEKDYYRMDTPEGASLTVPGLPTLITVEGENFHLLSSGNILDPHSRTIPLLIEIRNPGQLLKIGQTIQVDLYSTEGARAIAVPESAVFDDDMNQVVFVHTGGESFEKRIVKTGSRHKGLVAILSGIKTGERVVTKGGYMVKLASTSTAVGHPHSH